MVYLFILYINYIAILCSKLKIIFILEYIAVFESLSFHTYLFEFFLKKVETFEAECTFLRFVPFVKICT